MINRLTAKKIREEQQALQYFHQMYKDREAGDIENHVDKTLTVEDYHDMGGYYAVTFVEDTTHFFFAGGTLKNILERYTDDLRGLQVIPKPMQELRNGNEFRVYEIV